MESPMSYYLFIFFFKYVRLEVQAKQNIKCNKNEKSDRKGK